MKWLCCFCTLHRLYYKLFQQDYGASSGPLEVEHLERQISQLNAEMTTSATTDPHHSSVERYIALEVVDNDVIIAVCTPLMKRVHRYTKHSGEIVFMDAGGNMDRHNMRVFLLMTFSPTGGLPLGVLITTNERTDTITRALKLYTTLLDNLAFSRQGSKGPAVFMTDDCTAERCALHAVYPEATLLLCIFHVLQAFWRFLWDSNTGVPKNNRQHLFALLKGMVYATSDDALLEMFTKATADSLYMSYPKVHAHIVSLYDRRQEWALCCRQDLPVRSNNTNNYCERAMRVLKDNILHRTKAFNVPQLLDFIVRRFEAFYARKLQDVANNRLDNIRNSRFLPVATNIDVKNIKLTGPHVYDVPSEKLPGTVYTVNMFLGMCTCPQGNTGAPCKHQSAVMSHFRERSSNFLPVRDPVVRQLMYAIATGNAVAPDDWFQSLVPEADVHPSVESIPEACMQAASIQVETCMQVDTEPMSDDNEPEPAT